MYVKKLEVRNYRNYVALALELNRGLNVFVGENAQGKTNIAEAIYYLSSLRSHRTSKDKELIMWDKDKAYIRGEIERTLGTHIIEFLLSSEGKRAVKLDGMRVSKGSDVLGSVNVVIFSPEDLKLVKEGPAIRRKFIDGEMNQIRPKYHHAVGQYNHILLQRNNLLKSITRSPSLRLTAEVFSEQLAEYGSFISEARIEFIKKLSLIARLVHRKITNGKEELEIGYLSASSESLDRRAIKDELYNYYVNNINDDIEKGYTIKGPHRDDLLIKINGIDARIYGSQGQQRTAALSLKLSELEIIKSEVGEYPVLILDDVLSELDVGRQKFLLEALKEVQTILTCTSLNEIKEFHFENRSVFKVTEGRIQKTNDFIS